MYPKKVKFIGNTEENTLYKTGFRENKTYKTLVDDDIVLEIFDELGTVTVFDDNGDGHEIEKGDYIIIE